MKSSNGVDAKLQKISDLVARFSLDLREAVDASFDCGEYTGDPIDPSYCVLSDKASEAERVAQATVNQLADLARAALNACPLPSSDLTEERT